MEQPALFHSMANLNLSFHSLRCHTFGLVSSSINMIIPPRLISYTPAGIGDNTRTLREQWYHVCTASIRLEYHEA
jgi:hypothetical protein